MNTVVLLNSKKWNSKDSKGIHKENVRGIEHKQHKSSVNAA